MSEKAHKLGIQDRDLKRALLLFRHLRATAYSDHLDPRAIRIALLFTLKCDTQFAEEKLTPEQLQQLNEIADDLFKTAGGRA